MKKFLICVVLIALSFGAGVLWMKHSSGDDTKPGAEKVAGDKQDSRKDPAISLSRDTNGNTVVKIAAELQQSLGIKTAHPMSMKLPQQVEGFGKVLDPAPLAGALVDLATAKAAYAASSNELARLKLLESQGNASTRAVQAAEASALHDQLAIQAVSDKLALSWGDALAKQPDLPGFVKSLTALKTALVRVDLPAGVSLKATPSAALILALTDDSVEMNYFGRAAAVDPTTQGEGYLFVCASNESRFLPGQSVTGYVEVPGEPVEGWLIPGNAVIRADGRAWVYCGRENATEFTRTELPPARFIHSGLFVTNGISSSNSIVTSGAQMLLSEELKAASPPPD